MKALLLFFLATAAFAQSPNPTYIFTVRVSGTTVSVDKVDVIQPPTATPTPIPTIPGPIPSPTPIAVYVGWSAYPNAANYKIYYGRASGVYDGTITTGNVTKYKITFPPNTKYYVSAKPIDSNGKELATSNELTYP